MRYDAGDLAARADERRVREVAVERRRADERHGLGARARDLVDGRAGRTDESGPKQEILGRIAGDRELGEHDEIGRRPSRLGDRARDPLDVAVEVADDDVQLGEGEPHRDTSFRLMITNPTLAASGSGVPAEDHRRLALVPEHRERRRVEAVEASVRHRLPEPAGGRARGGSGSGRRGGRLRRLARARSITRSTRRPTSSGASPPGLGWLHTVQPGTLSRIVAVVIPSYAP